MNIQEIIDNQATIWRYMDFSKLLDIIVNEHLTFPRYDKFEDPFEGYSSNYMELVKNKYYKLQRFYLAPLEVHFEIGAIRNKIMLANLHSYVSCWHLNEYESAAMWKLYCSSSDSVAIKTRVGKLTQSLKDHSIDLCAAAVSYNSTFSERPKQVQLNITEPIFTKRESFEHEKEYRIVFHEFNNYEKLNLQMERDFTNYHAEKKTLSDKNTHTYEELRDFLESGKYKESETGESRESFFWRISKDIHPLKQLRIDPSEFIEEIVISPNSPKWFYETVKLTIEKLGYDLPIRKSNLYELN